MEKKYQGFEGLEVYKAARAFRIMISKLTTRFPPEEKYTLKNQLLRSARSISANIAEGYGRFHYQEFVQFCRIARGSLNESFDHLICAYDEGYLSQKELDDCRKDYQNLLRSMNGWIHYLNKQKQNEHILTNTTNSTNTTNTTTHA